MRRSLLQVFAGSSLPVVARGYAFHCLTPNWPTYQPHQNNAIEQTNSSMDPNANMQRLTQGGLTLDPEMT